MNYVVYKNNKFAVV